MEKYCELYEPAKLLKPLKAFVDKFPFQKFWQHCRGCNRTRRWDSSHQIADSRINGLGRPGLRAYVAPAKILDLRRRSRVTHLDENTPDPSDCIRKIAPESSARGFFSSFLHSFLFFLSSVRVRFFLRRQFSRWPWAFGGSAEFTFPHVDIDFSDDGRKSSSARNKIRNWVWVISNPFSTE